MRTYIFLFTSKSEYPQGDIQRIQERRSLDRSLFFKAGLIVVDSAVYGKYQNSVQGWKGVSDE